MLTLAIILGWTTLALLAFYLIAIGANADLAEENHRLAARERVLLRRLARFELIGLRDNGSGTPIHEDVARVIPIRERR